MDTLTQMAFGATVGQAGWRHRFGRRALLAGAIVGLLPDLDTLVSATDPFSGWLYHRGVTHSVVMGPLFGLAAGFAFWFYYRFRSRTRADADFARLGDRDALLSWLWLGVIVFVSHAWLDVLTPYGTQLFAPLSATRFAVNAMPIIDIAYTLILVAALIIGLRSSVSASWARSVAGAAVLLSVLWQFHAWDVNERAQAKARADLRAQEVVGAQIYSYPTLFTPWLRRVNAETKDEIHIGYWSLTGADEITWMRFAKQTHRLTAKVEQTRAFRILHWFAREQIFWRARALPDGGVKIEAHDLRYLNTLPDNGAASQLQPQLRGLWGIAQDFDKNGEPLGAPYRWTARPQAGDLLSVILSQTFRF